MSNGILGFLALLGSASVLVVIVVITFTVVQIRWNRMRREQAFAVLHAADEFEKQGKFKEACWKYALSLYHSPTPIPDAQTKVKSLWEKYGPFDFDPPLGLAFKFILETEGLASDTNEHMLYALYDGVMKEIEKLVDVATRDDNIATEDL